MIASVADSKSDLRVRIRAARAEAVGAAAGAQERTGLLAVARAAGLLDRDSTPGEPGAVSIAAYIAAPGEPDVVGLRDAVREAGGAVLLPIPRTDRTLDWALDDGRYRPEGRYPIEVPAGEVVGSGAAGLLAHGVRTVLVPALAVDMTGARLGQGGGYYDRLLAELATPSGQGGGPSAVGQYSAGVMVVAVVRDEELLPAGAVPRQAHDQVMLAALTPTRFVRFGR
jgi:5-formyltetrahydrofolate cyclo-ligase